MRAHAITAMLVFAMLAPAALRIAPLPVPEAFARPMSREAARREAQALSDLGRSLFFDKRLSASGTLACSSCHDPARAFGPANALPVQLGGGTMREAGIRAAPSLKYLQAVPSFTEHFHDSEDEADESVDNGPTGGLNWDGRVDRARDQAGFPLLSSFEMGNADAAMVARRVLAAGHGAAITAIIGKPGLRDHRQVYTTTVQALEAFQQDYRSFYPYSSKYDAYLAGEATLTEQEARGLSLFEAEDKGNCASCHISRRGNDGTPPQFTDYGLIALGVPRNPAIPANRDPNWFDLGLCGPLRRDFTHRKDYCGLFRTPTLRNVGLRQVFFHNGGVTSLRDAVRFYVERETRPENWYPRRADGSVALYDDLPDFARANVNMDPPFDRKAGQAPALTPAEIDDITAFLGTLTDGYRAGP